MQNKGFNSYLKELSIASVSLKKKNKTNLRIHSDAELKTSALPYLPCKEKIRLPVQTAFTEHQKDLSSNAVIGWKKQNGQKNTILTGRNYIEITTDN